MVRAVRLPDDAGRADPELGGWISTPMFDALRLPHQSSHEK